MAKINLLPWRERLREERKRQFFVGLAGSGLMALLIMLLVHFSISQSISSQQARNAYLNNEIKELDVKISQIKSLQKIKEALVARIGIIQELQADRTMVVRLFDELVKALPTGVHLLRIQRKGKNVILIGKAESNGNVSNLMRNVSKSKWLSNPYLREIKTEQADGRHVSEFSMQLTLVNPYADKEIQ